MANFKVLLNRSPPVRSYFNRLKCQSRMSTLIFVQEKSQMIGIFCSISDTSVIPQQHAVLQSMNIQSEDTSRSDPVFRDDGQNLEISARIRIISNSYPSNPCPSVIKQSKSGWYFQWATNGLLLWPLFHQKTPLSTLNLRTFILKHFLLFLMLMEQKSTP